MSGQVSQLCEETKAQKYESHSALEGRSQDLNWDDVPILLHPGLPQQDRNHSQGEQGLGLNLEEICWVRSILTQRRHFLP